MRRILLTGLFVFPSIILLAGGEEPASVNAVLKTVTVYRSGAELVHEATAVLSQGTHDLAIDNISSNIDKETLRVSCGGEVTILSASFTNEFLREEVSPVVSKRLADSIAVLKREQVKLDIQIKANNEQLELMSANKNMGGANGVNLVELAKLMDYYKQKSLTLRTEIEDWKLRSAAIEERITRLESVLEDGETKNDKKSGRILLQVMSPLGGSCKFTVSYISQAARWTPFYDLRLDNANDPLRIQYKARLWQTTGLDWKKVKLSLSTSTPGQGGVAPELKTWFLSFVMPRPVVVGYGTMKKRDVSGAVTALDGYVPGLKVEQASGVPGATSEIMIRGMNSAGAAGTPMYVVDGIPVDAAKVEQIDPAALENVSVLKDAAATSAYGARAANGVVMITLKKGMGDHVSVNDNTMDVTFDLDIPYDVPGTGKEQGVLLKEYKLACAYQYYCAPRLDKDVFLLGRLTGWEQLNLLPGEANIMVEGALIGKTYIDPGSVKDTLNLSLGRDKRVVVKKEKQVDYSSVKFLGSDKKQVFTYVISVKNNKKDGVQMLLKDQYPMSTDNDIQIELLDASGAEVDKDNGYLTWRLKLAAGESKSFKISYSVKYPKDRVLNL